MKVRALTDFGNIEDFENLKRFVTGFANEITDVVNGNLEFASNLKTSQIDNISFNSSPVTIQHGLGRVPNGYILVKSTAAITIFLVSDMTASIATLNSSGTATGSVLFF